MASDAGEGTFFLRVFTACIARMATDGAQLPTQLQGREMGHRDDTERLLENCEFVREWFSHVPVKQQIRILNVSHGSSVVATELHQSMPPINV